jgi:hypothetical protein
MLADIISKSGQEQRILEFDYRPHSLVLEAFISTHVIGYTGGGNLWAESQEIV